MEQTPVDTSKKEKTLASFLESTPPNTTELLADMFGNYATTSLGKKRELKKPNLQLHCENESCQGVRFFRYAGADVSAYENQPKNCFITYICGNCQGSLKTYALEIAHVDSTSGTAMKYGEVPSFGPPTPSRLISLIGPDRELFLRGRRAENLGFGIGSFAYYRRVVENQKGRIIHDIAKASERLGASPEMLEKLRQAEKETQFSTAIEIVKSGIPAALLINGHNPLTLLHTALSEGLHDHTDAECLEIAQEIRLVLTDLADRISQALKEEAELKKAVSRLMSRKKA
jgi:hypothetical protein